MYETLIRMPFLRLVIPCIAGIVVSYCTNIPYLHWIFFTAGIISASSLYLSKNTFAIRIWAGIGINCLIFAFACILTKQALVKTEWNYPAKSYNIYKVKILDYPVSKNRVFQCPILIHSIQTEKGEIKIAKKAILYLSKDSLSANLFAGDFLIIKTIFSKPEFAPGQSFNYADYLKSKGFACTGYVSSHNWEQIDLPQTFIPDIQSKALACQHYLLQKLNELIPDKKQFGIAAGIFFGYKHALDADLKIAFSTTGGAHILAVSGLHVGILYATLLFPFQSLGNSRKAKRLRQLIILPLMWAFAFITGLTPSVVRATSMLSFYGLAEIIGKKTYSLNIVGAAAFLMLIYNPLYLFEVGFQLSFSAVIAIISLNPLLQKNYWSRNPVVRYIWSLICVSTTAQIGTAPLSIYYFKLFPIIFLLTNLLIIPLTGILLTVLPVYLLLSCLVTLPEIILYPLHIILQLFISGIEVLTKIPFACISDIHLNVIDVISLYIAIFLFSMLLIRKKILFAYLLSLLGLFQLIYYL